jgi:hypothetical protein
MNIGFATIASALLLFGAAALSCSNAWDSGPSEPPDSTPSDTDLLGIGITPNTPKVTSGEEIHFIATGFYADRRTVDVTDVVTWTSTDEGVVAVSGSLDSEGIASTSSAGQANIVATLDGLQSNSARVTVTAAQILSLVIRPGHVSVHEGSEITVSAEASFSDGSHGDVTGTVRWITGNPAIVIVDPGGRITGNGVGVADVRAVYEQGDASIEAEPAGVTVVEPGEDIGNADLRVVGLSTASSGDDLVYTVEVKNSGTASASGFWVAAWLNLTAAPPAAPTEGDAAEYVAALEPDQTAEIVVRLSGVAPGNYSSWILVDSLAALDEGGLGENNNTWGPQAVEVTGGGGSIGPDLSITYFQVYVQASQGQTLYIVDVTNTGDEAAAAFDVGVFSDLAFPPTVGAAPDELQSVAGLAPGATAPISIVIRSTPSAYWQSYVLVDPDGVVTEPNEGNNLASFSVFP